MKEQEMNNEKITKERAQLLVDLESQMGDAMMNVLVPHDLNMQEGLAVIASAVLDILHALGDTIGEDHKLLRDMFIGALQIEESNVYLAKKSKTYLTDEETKQTVECLCCKHCLPPGEREDGKMCNLKKCKYNPA